MYDMTITLQADSKKCLYEQIYEYIRDEIREGKLLTGERLPSTRSLAEKLQVARSTVDYAYEQLLSEGYIEARPYRGFFVCRVEELLRLQEISDTSAVGERSVSGGMLGAVGTFTGAFTGAGSLGQAAQGRSVDSLHLAYDFHPNGIDMSGFPFGVWQRITKNVLSYDNNELFALGMPQGDEDLRFTISRYLHASRGVNCSPEQIIVGAGNDYLLMLLEKILGRHVRVAMENPSYKRAYRIFNSFAYYIERVGMDEHGMSVEDLEKSGAAVAYVMPSHQYPTGTVMSIGRRMELLKWAAEKDDRYLIEDDYDSEFRYRGKPIPSLQASDTMDKVIYIGTFSKAIAPAIRVSYMVLPEKLLEVYKQNCFFYSSTVSRIDQRILNEFISEGYFERYLNKARKIYKEKHDLLLECLKPFLKDFRLAGENAGLHILLTSKKGVPEQELLTKAAEHGVKVYAVSDAYLGTEEEKRPETHTVILGYAGMTLTQIKEGIEKLKEAWLS